MKRSCRHAAAWLAAAASIVLFPSGAAAQVTARIEGVVTDDAGNPVEGVEIYLKNAETNATLRPAKTRKTGKYLYIAEPGDYYIWPKLEGYMMVRMVADLRNQDGVGKPNTNFFDEKQTVETKVHFYAVGDLNSRSRNKVDFVIATADKHRATLDRLYAEYRGVKAGSGEAGAGGPGAAPAPVAEEKKDPFDAAVDLIAQKDFAGALPLLQEAVVKDPEDVERHYYLGRALLETDRLTDAETALRKAKELDATKPGVSYYLAQLYNKKGRKVQAVQALEEERSLSPDSEAVLGSLAALYSDPEIRQVDKAIEVYESLIASKPDALDAYISLAALHKDAGDKAKEEDVYKRMGDRDPTGDSLYNLGTLAFNRNEHDKASVYYRKVLERNPGHAKAHLQLGYSLVNLGDFGGAIQHFESFLKLSPKDPRAPEAKATMEELRKLAPPRKG
jgi:tetratricopeptide (TPR) repeat protein